MIDWMDGLVVIFTIMMAGASLVALWRRVTTGSWQSQEEQPEPPLRQRAA